MRTRPRVFLPLATTLALISAFALAGTVLAAETTLTATLAGASEGENPGDEDGSGTASIVIDPEEGTACWTLTAENIMPVTMSHIHEGAEGVSGGVVVPLDTDGFEGSSEGCIEPEDAAILQDIVDNPAGFYVNLHTADFEAGAIRGQLAASATPPNTALPMRDASIVGLLGALLVGLAMAVGLRAWRPIATRD